MKTCMINADLSSDSCAGQYSKANLCDDCVAGDAAREQGQRIFHEEGYDPDFGETCEWCGLTAEVEAQAWAE